jgi:hypothetical protein
MILMLVARFEIELGALRITHVAVFFFQQSITCMSVAVEILYIIFLTSASSLSICHLLLF